MRRGGVGVGDVDVVLVGVGGGGVSGRGGLVVIVVGVGVVGVKRPSVGRWSIGHQTIPTGCVTSHNWPDVSHFQNR